MPPIGSTNDRRSAQKSLAEQLEGGLRGGGQLVYTTWYS